MDLITLAGQAVAAADLDDQARGRVDVEIEFGDTAIALGIAVLETRRPLRTEVLDQVAVGAAAWYANAAYRRLVLDAVARQKRQNVA
ncbi:MAG: hypothetical protein ABI253_02330 [Mycobacterium sp.]